MQPPSKRQSKCSQTSSRRGKRSRKRIKNSTSRLHYWRVRPQPADSVCRVRRSTVDINQVLSALERERELLREFHDLSSKQLVLLDDENLDGMDKILDTRSELMLELTAIESTLGTWITQLRNERKITNDVLHELRLINDEIVHLANEIVELDEQTHWRLDLIKQRSADEMRSINKSQNMLSGYYATLRIQPDFKSKA